MAASLAASSDHLVPPAFWFEDALHRLGCIATPGGIGNTEFQVRMMHDLKVTGYVGTPSFLVNISKKAQEAGYELQRDLHLEVGFVAGEMLTESLRDELEQGFQMMVRQGYGTGDLSYFTDEPCRCGRTTHRLTRILGRLDQVTKVKGMFIHPDNADEVAVKFPEIDRYQVVVTRDAHVDHDLHS